MSYSFERLLVTVLTIALFAAGYFYADGVNIKMVQNGGSFAELYSWVDAYIPFIPEFVYGYYLYYLWVLIALPVMRTRERFYQMVAAFGVLQFSALLTFVLFPSHMNRPEIYADSIAATMVKWIYHADTGFNLLPSLHVGHSILVTLFFYEYARKFLPIIVLGTIFIISSTVFIKQHYFIDIPFGVLYAAIAWYVTRPVSSWVGSFEEQRRNH
ncbi:MAG: phosphatase PAP2 family protein [Bacteroidia bacterium]|nr:phosphatase PAP2 family protein [Bacteroidia bacterium]